MKATGNCEVAIIGGGPAGLAGAVAMSACGMDVCLVDEQPRLGGQIYRQPPVGFRVDSWLAGRIYDRGRALLASTERLSGLRHIAPATVWGIFPVATRRARTGFHILLDDNGALGRIAARHVLLATGCYEAPVPFPGWHLPGVMSAGGIQTLLKSQRVAAGTNVVLAGTHPLLLVAASQLLAAGMRVAAVVFTQPLSAVWRVLGSPVAALSGLHQALHAMHSLVSLRRARVPIMFGRVVVEAFGADAVEGVRVRPTDFQGDDAVIPCDAVGMCYGFLACSELARQAGARSTWEEGSGWVVDADEIMCSSVPGLSVAGELIGVAGAEAAACSGEIAGLGIAADAGHLTTASAQKQSAHARRRLERIRRFARLLRQLTAPDPALLQRLVAHDTLICRCEDVTVGAVSDALLADGSLTSASSVKLLTRTGMGVCQGRMCEISVRRLIARHRRCDLGQVGGYVPRLPAKPVPLGLLAADPGALDIEPDPLVAGNATMRAPTGY